MWRDYSRSRDCFYLRGTVNQSEFFIDPQSGANVTTPNRSQLCGIKLKKDTIVTVDNTNWTKTMVILWRIEILLNNRSIFYRDEKKNTVKAKNECELIS